MAKKIHLKLSPDGKIFAKTEGMFGEDCLEAIPLLEDLLQAQAIRSFYTEDFYQGQNQNLTLQEDQTQQQTQQERPLDL